MVAISTIVAAFVLRKGQTQILPYIATSPNPLELPRHPPIVTSSRSPIFGREEHIAQLEGQLLHKQLIILTGTGGIGKTRLAKALREKVAGNFPDGTFYIRLTGVRDYKLVVGSIAEQLDIQTTGYRNALEALKRVIAEKRILLVLDNFEQVADAAKDISDLLDEAPNLKVIITSRICLEALSNYNGCYEVPALEVPEQEQTPDVRHQTECGSVEMFIEKARVADPGADLTSERSVRLIAQICYRVQGIPLAIKLTAAQLRVYSLAEVLTSLNKPLDCLASGCDEHDRNLEATIEWSHNLIKREDTKKLFRRLAAFRAGFTHEALQNICTISNDISSNNMRDAIAELIGSSLIWRKSSVGSTPHGCVDANEENRFDMFVVIREFAEKKLQESGEQATITNQHANYYLNLVEKTGLEAPSVKHGFWLDKLVIEQNNMRAAIDNSDVMMRLRFVGALERFWDAHGYLGEGLEKARNALQEAKRRGVSASSEYAKALLVCGRISIHKGQNEEARDCFCESIKALKQIPDERKKRKGLAQSFINMGRAYHHMHDYKKAGQAFRIGERFIDDDNLEDRAYLLQSLGRLALRQGYYTDAVERLVKSRQLYDEIDDIVNVGASLESQGRSLLHAGQYVEALNCFKEALEQFRALRNKRVMAWCLSGLAEVACEQRHWIVSAQLFGATDTAFASINTTMDAVEADEYKSFRKKINERLITDDALLQAYNLGHSLTLNDAVDYALREA
jgi:predicted ATPase